MAAVDGAGVDRAGVRRAGIRRAGVRRAGVREDDTVRRPWPLGTVWASCLVAVVVAASPATGLAQDVIVTDPDPATPRDPALERAALRTGSARDEAAEILVIATRRAGHAFELPWSTAVSGADEFVRERSRRTLADALIDLPGIAVQRTSYGQASPFVRGFTGYHTVLLVDGIRLNNSTFRSGPNQYWGTVDALATDRVEVVRGPSSVLYGSDAVGGAVNAVARRRTSFDPGEHGHVRSYLRYASAEDSWVARMEVEGNAGDLGVLAGVTRRSFDDVRPGDSDRRQDGTGYGERDADVRLDFRESRTSSWAFGWQRAMQRDVPRTHTTLDSVPYHGTSQGDELRRDLTQERTLLYLRNRREVSLPFADTVEATVSLHRQDEEQIRVRDSDAPRRSDRQGVDVETLGLQVQLEKDTPFGIFTYGVEAWGDDVSSFRSDYEDGVKVLEQVQGPVADDARYSLLGVYAQDEVRFGDTEVTVGARWTRAAADADRVDDPTVSGGDPATPGNVISLDDSWRDVSASVRAVHRLCDTWRVFGGVSQGFRAPNLSDLTRLDDTSGRETPSLDLDPEEFLQAEVGVRAAQGRWSGQLAFWHTRIDDLIVPSPTGGFVGSTPEVRKDNVGDGWARGIEAEVGFRIDDAWTAAIAGTWQDGEVDQQLPSGAKVRRPLSRLMPLTGVVTLTWREPGAPWRAWISGRFADAQDQLSLKDATDTQRIPPGGTPGYGVVSLGMSFEIADGATLSVTLDNVADREYRLHGSGVNEPGRSLTIAFDLRF